jgi:hypothetical protein
MRTKSLLAAAAILAAGALTSMAQSNVYSLNVVGYYNLSLTNGFNLVANQLDKDGTGTNNTVYTVIGTNVPNLTRIYAFDPVAGSFSFATFTAGTLTWIGAVSAVNAALSPGQGVWVQIPASASPQTVTVVGEVKQGTLTTPVGSYYQILASQVPQVGGIQTALGYTPANLDRVYRWLPGIQNYDAARTYLSASGTWSGGGEPSVGVGESFWIQGHAGSAWTRNFTVQ